MINQGAQESLAGGDTWNTGDDVSKAPIDMMTRSYGVLKTFGPQWASITPEQRQAVVKGLVNQGLLKSQQGDYLIDNVDQAQTIFQSVLGGGTGTAPAAPTTTQPAVNTSSTTRDMAARPTQQGKPSAQAFAQAAAAQPTPVSTGGVIQPLQAPQAGQAAAAAVPVLADPNHPIGMAAIADYMNRAKMANNNFGFGDPFGGAMRPSTQWTTPAAPMGTVNVPAGVTGVPVAPAAPALPPRSQTSSPGIGKDGKRLTPEQIGQMMAKRINKKSA